LEVEIDQRGTKITLANMIMKLTDDDDKPLLFFGVEPTKLTHTDGRYLLLTKKDLIDKADRNSTTLLRNLPTKDIMTHSRWLVITSFVSTKSNQNQCLRMPKVSKPASDYLMLSKS
jgi:hypothetical protein